MDTICQMSDVFFFYFMTTYSIHVTFRNTANNSVIKMSINYIFNGRGDIKIILRNDDYYSACEASALLCIIKKRITKLVYTYIHIHT